MNKRQYLLLLLVAIWLISAFASTYVYANEDCNAGQNLLSKTNNTAIELRSDLARDACAEEYFGGVERFFSNWLTRSARLSTFTDEAAIWVGTAEVCLNYYEYTQYITGRFDALVNGFFAECFGVTPNGEGGA